MPGNPARDKPAMVTAAGVPSRSTTFPSKVSSETSIPVSPRHTPHGCPRTLSGQGDRQQQAPLGSKIGIFDVEVFVKGVRTRTGAAAADGHGRNAEIHRHVGIGGTLAQRARSPKEFRD